MGFPLRSRVYMEPNYCEPFLTAWLQHRAYPSCISMEITQHPLISLRSRYDLSSGVENRAELPEEKESELLLPVLCLCLAWNLVAEIKAALLDYEASLKEKLKNARPVK